MKIEVTAQALDDRENLKLQYQQALARLSREGLRIARAAEALLDVGVTRQELEDWAVEWGYQRQSIRSVLSRLLCHRGQRQRRIGAGRKKNPLAAALWDFLSAQLGRPGARKLIRATHRLADAEAKSPLADPEPHLSPPVPLIRDASGSIRDIGNVQALIVSSQLDRHPSSDLSRH
jgi:hypothetical protein